jgi:hypothetical protein
MCPLSTQYRNVLSPTKITPVACGDSSPGKLTCWALPIGNPLPGLSSGRAEPWRQLTSHLHGFTCCTLGSERCWSRLGAGAVSKMTVPCMSSEKLEERRKLKILLDVKNEPYCDIFNVINWLLRKAVLTQKHMHIYSYIYVYIYTTCIHTYPCMCLCIYVCLSTYFIKLAFYSSVCWHSTCLCEVSG